MNECEKSFDQVWKLNAHKKVHEKYACEKCEKSFQYESIKDIHNKVTHNNVKLFCHYYNNDKECPNDQECVFLHEVSGPCRYMEICERENCMYQHISDKETDENDNYGNTNYEADEDDDEDDDEHDEDDDGMDNKTDNTFYNHAL